MRNLIKLPLILFLVTLIAGSLLGVSNALTREPIRLQNELALKAARDELFEKSEFTELNDIALSSDNENVTAIFEAKANGDVVGYVITMTKTGYGGDIQLNYGVTTDGVLTGVIVGTNSETPGLGAKASEIAFAGQFPEKSNIELVKGKASEENEVSAITAATITSQAIVDGANQAIAVADLVMEN